MGLVCSVLVWTGLFGSGLIWSSRVCQLSKLGEQKYGEKRRVLNTTRAKHVCIRSSLTKFKQYCFAVSSERYDNIWL